MIIRSKRALNYTVISNPVIEDLDLDWKELGLLVYLLSKPDSWDISVAHLAKQRKAGRDAVLNMLKSLRDAGYVELKHKPEGGVDYYVFDSRQEKPLTEKPLTEKPLTEKPLTEKPLTDNPHLVSTDIPVSTEEGVNTEVEINPTAWDEFLDHRKSIKKPASSLAQTKLKNILKKYTYEQQQYLVDYSIAGRYPNLYENQLRNFNGTQTNQTVSRQSSSTASRVHDRNKREYAIAVAEEQGVEDIRLHASQVSAQVGISD